MNKMLLSIILLSMASTFSECKAFIFAGMNDRKIETGYHKKLDFDSSDSKPDLSQLANQKAAKIESNIFAQIPQLKKYETLFKSLSPKQQKEIIEKFKKDPVGMQKMADTYLNQKQAPSKEAIEITAQPNKMSTEEYALKALSQLACRIEQQINQSSFLNTLVAYKKTIDADATKKDVHKETALFDGLSKDLAVSFVHISGEFAVNQCAYHFTGLENVSIGDHLIAQGIGLAQLSGVSRTPMQFLAISRLLTNIKDSIVNRFIAGQSWLTGPVENIIKGCINTDSFKTFLLDQALFFDSSDLAHNLLEKVFLSKGMNNVLKTTLGLQDNNPLLWMHKNADIGIAGVRIYSLIEHVKKQTYNFDLDKISEGLENGTITTSEATRMFETLLSTTQEITTLAQRFTKTDNSENASSIQTMANTAIAQIRSLATSLQSEIRSLKQWGAIEGFAAIAGAPV